MLDVHPPHAAAHSWKDFLIHIATIVIGLLIAIGLEQTVEAIHHHHQVAETREALRVERDQNIHAYALAMFEFHRQTSALINNLTVLVYLQQHPGTPQARLPGILVWHSVGGNFGESAWKTAQQNNVTALMPQDEVRRDDFLYRSIDNANRTFGEVWPAIVQARLYAVLDPDPSHMTPQQLANEIELTKVALAKHFAQSAALVQLNRADPGFGPGLTPGELNRIMRITDAETNHDLAAAIALTNTRLPAASQLPIP